MNAPMCIPCRFQDRGSDYDASSLDSGDDVFIGVEDKDEFKNYKGHKNVRHLNEYI